MSARDFAPAFAIGGLGDPLSIRRLTDQITALSTQLAAEPGRYDRQELFEIRDNLGALALAIVRIKRLVSDRIAVLTAGACNGY